MTINRRCLRAFLLTVVALGTFVPVAARSASIAFAGLTYAGNFGTIEERFRYSKRFERALTASGGDANAKLRQILSGRQYPFTLTNSIEGKGDEVLVTALMVTGEIVSHERFGPVHKLFVQIRAQTLIFDFASKKVVRTYPLSFTYLDALDHSPSDEEIDDRVAKAFEGAQGKRGIFGRYADALAALTLPHQGDPFLQITKVSIEPEASAGVRPGVAASDGVAEASLADYFGEALNSKAGVALFPYAAGYAIGGVMQMRLSGTDYNLQIPPPDWEINIDLTGVKKVKYAENAVGTSFVYGAYATIKISERGGTHTLLDAQFKNGEVKEVPVSQTYVDDLPAYSDSIRGLFDKVAQVLGGQDLPWLRNAAVTANIGSQITATRGLLQKCK